MAESLPTAYVEKFKNDFIMLAQQKDSRLLKTVRQDPEFFDGKYGHFDRIGTTSFQEKTERAGDTPNMDVPHSRRRFARRTYNWGKRVDIADVRRVITNPQNSYLRAALAGRNRKIDDIIINAATADVTGIDEDGATSTITFPSSQRVTVGGSPTGLTKAKLLEAKEILDGNEADEEMMRFCIVTSKQVTELLNITEVASADYNTVKALAEGKVDTWLGYKFIRTERLKLDANGDREVLVYDQLAFGASIDAAPSKLRIGENPQKSYTPQIYIEFEGAAVRVEDERIVAIACNV